MTSEGKDALERPGKLFWEACERLRNSRGWTKSELAKRAGIGRKTYDRLKVQPNKPLPETINKVADALDIPRPEAMRLAGLDPEPAGTKRDIEDLSPPPEPGIEEILAKLPAGRRRRLEQFRAEEREHYEQRLQQAREDYLRSIGRLAEMARWEMRRHRGSLPDDDPEDGYVTPI